MPLVFKPELKRIKLEKGEWVDVKARLSYNDVKAVNQSDVAMLNDGQMDAAALWHKIGFIQAWNMKGEEGQTAPINADTISMLDMRQFSRLMEEFRLINPLGIEQPTA